MSIEVNEELFIVDGIAKFGLMILDRRQLPQTSLKEKMLTDTTLCR